jgi:hypothetical protein
MIYGKYEVISILDCRYLNDTFPMDVKKIDCIVIANITGAIDKYPTCGVAFSLLEKKAIILQEGNMSFNSTGGGHAALYKFIEWMQKNEITRIYRKYIKREDYDKIHVDKIIDAEKLYDEYRKEFINKTFEERFEKWKNGEKDW